MKRVVVVGSGIAGLTVGLGCAKKGHKVTLVTKSDLSSSSTNWAQGGIAGVLDASDEDAIQQHIKDTLAAGCNLNDPEVVEQVIRNAPHCLASLIEAGVSFDRDSHGEFAMAMEGGHSEKRILHHKDRTGAEIEGVLLTRLQESGVEVHEESMAIDLILSRPKAFGEGVVGIWVLDAEGNILALAADAVILASGGFGHIFERTTNPSISTGDGLIMALRAGAAGVDLEFVQFHPTVLAIDGERPFLLTEAMRGAGAIIAEVGRHAAFRRGEIGIDDLSFLHAADPRGNLATRDIIARAIDKRLLKTGDQHVFLVTEHLDSTILEQRFPTIASRLSHHGIRLGHDPIPIAPAAHYAVGGLKVNLRGHVFAKEEFGGDAIPGLYAVGEVACTGLHGANRLASNSLLEAVVMASHLVEHLGDDPISPRVRQLPIWRMDELGHLTEHGPLTTDRMALQSTMTRDVGIHRSGQRLRRAQRRLSHLRNEIMETWRSCRPTRDLVELRNLVLAAEEVTQSALKRSENIGLHHNSDNE